MANIIAISSAGKQKSAQGTLNHRNNELESQKITITISSHQPMYKWLPSIDLVSKQKLDGFYLEVSPDFVNEIQDWALCFNMFDPPMSEYKWATDVFAKFLLVQIYPLRLKKDLIKLCRQQQPYISMISGNYVLLLLKDHRVDSVSSKVSQKLDLIKRKKRISILPKLDIKDRFELNKPTKGSFVTIYKENPSIYGLKPDFMYASLITLLKDNTIYISYLAI